MRLFFLVVLLSAPLAAARQAFECNVFRFCHLDDPCRNPPIEALIELTIDANDRSATYSPRGGDSLQLTQVDGSLPETLHYVGKDAGAGAVFLSLFPSRLAIFVHHSLVEDIPGSITLLTRCEET